MQAELVVPESLAAGEYTLEIGITDGKTNVLFANATPRTGAFSELAKITVN